jgi:hypothetical protein
MDELNLASHFAGDDEEDQRPNRRKRKPRFHTGVGMEKPVEEADILDDIGGVEADPGEHSPAEIPAGEPDLMPAPDEEGEDDAFEALVGRMEGESASAGRARKRRAMQRKPGNDSLRKELADRM